MENGAVFRAPSLIKQNQIFVQCRGLLHLFTPLRHSSYETMEYFSILSHSFGHEKTAGEKLTVSKVLVIRYCLTVYL